MQNPPRNDVKNTNDKICDGAVPNNETRANCSTMPSLLHSAYSMYTKTFTEVQRKLMLNFESVFFFFFFFPNDAEGINNAVSNYILTIA